MKFLRIISITTLAVCLSACGTAPRSKATPAPLATSATTTTALTLEPVQWQVPASAAITQEEQAQLRARLRDALQAALAAKADSDRPLSVRATITGIEPVSPGLNALSALLLFVPLDAGAASVRIEAFDTASGVRVATWENRYAPPMRQLRARFKRLAPAELALQHLAETFAAELAISATPATAFR